MPAAAVASYKVKFAVTRPGQSAAWSQVGLASLMDDGTIRVVLQTLPLPHMNWDGQLVLFPDDRPKK